MSASSTSSSIAPDSLSALRALKEAKLLKTTTEDDSDDSLCFSWPEDRVRFEDSVVTFLDLGNRRLHRGLTCVDAFSSLTKLRTLNLGGTDIPVSDIEKLVNVLPTLECLFLGGNGLGNDNFTLTSLPESLIKLDVRYNDIGKEGVEKLCELLSMTSLRILHLEGNQLGDDGATVLATWIRESNNAKLEELYLGANGIGPSGAMEISSCVAMESSRLTKLYLEGNQMGPAGADAFSDVLEGSPASVALKHLYVDNNGIGKSSMQRLGRALNSATMIGDPSEMERNEDIAEPHSTVPQ